MLTKGDMDRNISVSASSKMPLYHQIYLIIRQKIVDGSYPYGTVLPGEMELAQEYDVSRITAKRTLNELAIDGYVTRNQGRGTNVSYRPSAAPIESSVDGLLENLLAMGLETEVSLLKFGYVSANNTVADALDIDVGEDVQYAIRIRRLDGEAFSYLRTYVPKSIGQKFDANDLSEKPLLTLLEGTGVRVTAATQVITATLADAEVASHLDVNIGDPLLKVTRVVLDQKHRPVEYIIALYRPEKYQYRMSLSRSYGDGIGTWAPHHD